jgi:hypothetical protein
MGALSGGAPAGDPYMPQIAHGKTDAFFWGNDVGNQYYGAWIDIYLPSSGLLDYVFTPRTYDLATEGPFGSSPKASVYLSDLVYWPQDPTGEYGVFIETYYPLSGTLDVTTVPSATTGGTLAGTLTNVTFFQMRRDTSGMASIPGDCIFVLGKVAFSLTIPPP